MSLLKQLILFSFVCYPLLAESFWQDGNPFSSQKSIQEGTTIKVLIKDKILTLYEYESHKDDKHTIKTAPDKKIVADLMGFHSDRSIAGVSNGKAKSTGKIIGSLAVRVKEKDEISNTFVLEGFKTMNFDGQIYQLKLSGIASAQNLKNSVIESDSIANLKIEFQGKPRQKIINDPKISLKEYKDRDGTIVRKARLSEEEKQKIILDYMKRMLGESK